MARRDKVTIATDLINKIGKMSFTEAETQTICASLDELKQTLTDKVSDKAFNEELEALYKKYGKKLK